MKRTLSLISKGLFLLLLCSILDSAIYLIFDSRGASRIVRGDWANIVGTLNDKDAAAIPKDEGADDNPAAKAAHASRYLLFRAESRYLHMELAEVRGRIWRGRLDVSPEAMEGEYLFAVLPKAGATDDKAGQGRVRVFESRRALRDSYASFFLRYTGVEPWWITGGTMVGVGLLLAAVYLIGGRETREMQARGLGPIYRLVPEGQLWEMTFGLGREHGVNEGDRLAVLDADGHWLAEFSAYQVGAEMARGRLDKSIPVKHDCLVARMWREDDKV